MKKSVLLQETGRACEWLTKESYEPEKEQIAFYYNRFSRHAFAPCRPANGSELNYYYFNSARIRFSRCATAPARKGSSELNFIF